MSTSSTVLAPIPPLPQGHPRTRSLIHALGFGGFLLLLWLVGTGLDYVPTRGHAGAWLGGYGHELLLDVGLAITLSVSLNLIMGLTGQFSLGHAGFLAAGAFTSALLAGQFFAPQLRFWCGEGGPFHFSINLGFTLIMLTGVAVGALVAALLGLLVGLPTLRLRGDYLAIATLGFSEILIVVLENFRIIHTDGREFTLGLSTGLSLTSLRGEWLADQDATPFVDAIQTYMNDTQYFVGFFWVFALAAISIYIVHNIKYATTGRALLAIREDPIASEAVGVPTTRYKIVAFIIGAALAGAAGGLLSHHKSIINPESFRFMSSSFTGSITIVAMVILGGQGSITGAVLGTILLTVVPEALKFFTSFTSHILHTLAGAQATAQTSTLQYLSENVRTMDMDKWRMVIYSILIILMMLFRPRGLLGQAEITDLYKFFRRPKRGFAVVLKAMSLPEPATVPTPALLVAEIPPDTAVPLNTDPKLIEPTLAVHNLGMSFGGLRAVDQFSLTLLPRELVGLIGPNGAGKTTIFNLLTGVYRPTNGTMQFHGKTILGLKPHRISQVGIARTFQNIRLFANLTVLDNVMIAQHAHHRQGITATILRTPAFFREERLSREVAMELLALFNLQQLAYERAGSLSYGAQRRLEIARALASRPRLLLLDEPAAGMNPTEKRQLMELISQIRQRFGLTILLIEHDMQVVMGICERIVVLDYGKTIACGTPAEIRQNPAVIEAYLGTPDQHGFPSSSASAPPPTPPPSDPPLP